jgi:tetratricopeptide (TPR) repeat protein
MTDNPSFPHVIPIVRRPLQTSIDVETADSIKVKQIATRQSLAITAFSLGLYYYFDPNYPRAAEQFEIARAHLESGPGPADMTDLGLVYYYLGKSYQMLGKFEQSQEMLNRAAELNPDDPAAVLGQMYNYRVMGQEELEQQALERAIALCNQLPGDHIAAIYDRAIAYEAMEDDEAALREYRAIMRLDPTYFIAYLSAARALVRLDDPQTALGMLQETQALAEGDPVKQVWLHLDTGRVYEKIGQTEAAIQEYNQAVDLDPTLVTPYFYLASL